MANSALVAPQAVTAPKYQHALRLSIEMLDTAQQGQWDILIELNTHYVLALQSVLENIHHEDDEMASYALTVLLNNEKEIRGLLKHRLDALSGKIDVMRQNQKCSNAYSNQMFSPYR